jgi:hypothetical protein
VGYKPTFCDWLSLLGDWLVLNLTIKSCFCILPTHQSALNTIFQLGVGSIFALIWSKRFYE